MKSKKSTVVFGASINPARTAYIAAQRLLNANISTVLLSIKAGELFGQEFIDMKTRPALENVHTVTLYIGTKNQAEWIDFILSLNPKRIIFNPGTENFEFAKAAQQQGIETLNACTLVMLGTGQY